VELRVAQPSSILTASPPHATREYGLDWLRVFAFAVLIFYHSGMVFVSWDFHIKNNETSRSLEAVMLFCNRWRLSLLFLISGAAVFFSLRRRSWPEFAWDRVRRLLLPLAVGMFVIVPPQIYFERLHRGAAFASYAEFYPTVFEFVPYPEGSFSWHHLWFLAYVLVFSLICMPVFALIKSAAGGRAVERMASAFDRHPPAFYLVAVPSILVGLTLGPRWPVTHNLIADWANFASSLITFLWGFVIASSPRLLTLITRRRREFLAGGIAVAALFFILREVAAGGGIPQPWRRPLGVIVSAYFGMTWIFALVGYARAKIRAGGPWLRYATEAVYPFYIVHQTITIALGYYVVQWPVPLYPKMLVVAVGTFAGSWIAFEIIRRVRALRPLFGMKPAGG
jgi:peptidoglycan/LPS O-acetylase OafA/YrhL